MVCSRRLGIEGINGRAGCDERSGTARGAGRAIGLPMGRARAPPGLYLTGPSWPARLPNSIFFVPQKD
jgi:hypothetical protein